MAREVMSFLLLATTLIVAVGAADPPDADLDARCFRNVGCLLDDEIEFQSIRDCCVNDPRGRSYNIIGSEICGTCVVFGWNVVNTSLIEQGEMHRLRVNFAKQGGISNTINFNVMDTGEGTAVSGAGRDYTLSTNRVSLRPGMDAFVDVIFRSDSVALEPPETVRLRLEPDGTTSMVPEGNGIFCIDELELTIIDHDVLVMELTEDDYRAGEADEAVTVTVRKNFRIATPITFSINPVTLQQAKTLNLFPGSEDDLPSNNSNRSPIAADANDFNTTNLTMLFEADEETTPREEIPIQIDVVDDALNEAQEQDFVAILTVESVIDPDSFRYARRSSLCRIIDNDPIRIGFVLERYTFEEPQFEDVMEVVLATENGVMSEQTFEVSLTISDVVPDGSGFGIAEFGTDYGGFPSRTFNRNFGPFQQTSLLIPIDLFPDNDPEPTEAFLISSAPNVLPTFLAPSSPLYQRTFVVIEDDDIVIRVGFENTSYTVNENIGVQEVCVRIFVDDNIDLPLGDGLIVAVETVAGTADESDYGRIDPLLNGVLVFTNDARRHCLALSITEDVLVEGVEQLSLTLSEDPIVAPTVVVEFAPNVTEVTIIDTDVATIGFFETNYTGFEADGYATVTFGFTSGGVQEPVQVMLSLRSGTALEGTDFLDEGPVFVFDRLTTAVSYNVTLVNDQIAELVEDFVAQLSLVEAVDRVSIDPELADVIIVDDDRVTIGLEQPSYTVDEGNGTVMVCAAIVSGTLERTLTFRLTTQDESATSPADFSSVSVDLTFDESTSRACVDIPIIDDLDVENLENFTVVIGGDDPDIDFVPSTSTVTIIDNDIIMVTLDPTPRVSVPETEGSLTICVQISSPPEDAAIEREPFFVSLSTTEGTARDPSDYTGIDLLNFGPFSSSMRRQCSSIGIVLDSEAEESETFTVNLSEEVDGVAVSPTGAMTTVTIIDSIRRVNDTVIGDPLMTVPIYLPDKSIIPDLGENDILNLCYEVHGEADANFNLVSDQCVSVNARYTQVRPDEAQNIISEVYVRATDNAGVCRNIRVSLDSCAASVDGEELDQTQRLNQMGISVRRYTNRVRIAVPNCQDLDLVMWVICEQRTFWSSQVAADGSEITFQADMIKFVIARGLNLQESSHGILGQFWNIPISISPITIPGSAQRHYTVEVEYPGGDRRSFVGMLWPLTWEYREEYCLYVGNGQAGPLDEADTGGGPNDPVIEGDYSEYVVESGFGTDFRYTHFDETMCV